MSFQEKRHMKTEIINKFHDAYEQVYEQNDSQKHLDDQYDIIDETEELLASAKIRNQKHGGDL